MLTQLALVPVPSIVSTGNSTLTKGFSEQKPNISHIELSGSGFRRVTSLDYKYQNSKVMKKNVNAIYKGVINNI